MKLGERGERIAARFLKRLGYGIIARNYRCPAGEIDIIALDQDTVVFVEVKTRSSTGEPFPESQVNYHKQRQLTRVARTFLAARGSQDPPCRFDVVAAVVNERGKPAVDHFINAFEPVYR